MSALIFAVSLAVMYAAHSVADHVFGQTDHDAANKAKPGEMGWIALLSHVVKYHVVMVLMLAITFSAVDITVSTSAFVLAMSISFASHCLLDRRWPVKWILENTGAPEFAKMVSPVNGMYQADQSLHLFFLWISALVLTVS